jgi:hypothetical protein
MRTRSRCPSPSRRDLEALDETLVHVARETQRSRDLILHMGAHKTGSSALQVAFARNREQLAARGVLYPRWENDEVVLAGGVDSGNGLPLAWFLVPSMAPRGRDIASELDRALVTLDDEADSILYSSEFLYRFDDDRWEQLNDRVAAHGRRLRAVVYVRDISGHALSMYGQQVKRGLYTETFSTFIDPSRGDYSPGFASPIERLVRTVGRRSVVVIHYDSVRESIFRHWCRCILGVEPDSSWDVDLVEGVVNRSLTVLELRLMRSLNSKLAGKSEARRVSDALIACTPLTGEAPRLSGADAKTLHERFDDEVHQVNELGTVGGPVRVLAEDVRLSIDDQDDVSIAVGEQSLVNVIARLVNPPALGDSSHPVS